MYFMASSLSGSPLRRTAGGERDSPAECCRTDVGRYIEWRKIPSPPRPECSSAWPVADVFEAVVDPEVTTRFWFTRSTGKLEAGKRVRWDWEMYGQSADVDVEAVEENERILMRWPAYESGGQTTVEWTFTPHSDDMTFVTVANTGFSGDQEAIAKQAIGATEGFTLVLAGMKALLEHGIELNLVRDRFPEGVEH
jgi:uncharacterized protein YndB with AHSA1/START domain